MRIDKVEETMAKVRANNEEEARKMGLTLEEWHGLMSRIGNAAKDNTSNIAETVIYNSADYILSYLFPQNRKKKKK